MGFFNNFPYTNFHELNTDWILQAVKELLEKYPEDFAAITQKIAELSEDVSKLSEKVENFDYNYISGLLEKYIPAQIFPEITDAGYIVFNIPENWDNITFSTTGVDIELELQPEYGHLVLNY